MKFHKKILMNGLSKAWAEMRKEHVVVFESWAADVVFLIVFFMAYYFFLNAISTKGITLIGITGMAIQEEVQQGSTGFFLASQEEMASLITALSGSILGLVITTYLLYCLGQGISLFVANRQFMKKLSWKQYLGRFLGVNLLWYGLFAVVALYYAWEIVAVNVFKLQGNLTAIGMTAKALFAILLYLAIISYVLIRRHGALTSLKRSCVLGVREFPTIGAMAGIMVLGIVAIDMVLRLLSLINDSFMVVIGILLLFPFLAWARLAAVHIVSSLDEK